jgi:hypothetical protein
VRIANARYATILEQFNAQTQAIEKQVWINNEFAKVQ